MTETRQILTPYLCCGDGLAALDYYERGFGARVTRRYVTPDGILGHADLEVCGASFMVSGEWPSEGVFSPTKYGGTPCSLHLYVPDAEAFMKRAVEAGAQLVRPATPQPHGDRMGVIRDPSGHVWFISTPIEEVELDELRRRVGDGFEVT